MTVNPLLSEKSDIQNISKPYLYTVLAVSFIWEFVTNTNCEYSQLYNPDIPLAYHLDTKFKYDSILS